MTRRWLPVALPARPLVYAGVAAFATGFSALATLRHEAFNSGRFDLGNMVQAVWSTSEGHPLRITDLQGDQISRLAAHFDPVLALLAPLWWLWPSPAALLVLQAATLSLGAFPVFWLARKHVGSDRAGGAFALAYLLYPATQWLSLDDFHPVALACPALLFAFWYLDQDQLLLFGLFSFLAVLTREEVALAVAAAGVWYALGRRRWLAGAGVAVAGMVVATVAVAVVIPHFNDGRSSTFYGRYSEVGGSPGGILRTAFTDPLRLLEVALDGNGFRYMAELVLPLAALSLLSPLALLPALPQLALNLLSTTPTQTSIHFHYTATIIPAIFLAAVLGAGRLERSGRLGHGSLTTLLLAAALASNYRLGAIPLWQHLPGGESLQGDAALVTAHDRIAQRALELVPADAAVSSTNSLGAHLSARERILSFPVIRDATWVLADVTKPSYADRIDEQAEVAMAARLGTLRQSKRWRLVFERDGILVFRRR
ncbi:MAG: DUF2079 domain-containing protein [Actinobacteria bacterium]|nr:DUF2079 domain-containing protein [Actinomycetota bacterium]